MIITNLSVCLVYLGRLKDAIANLESNLTANPTLFLQVLTLFLQVFTLFIQVFALFLPFAPQVVFDIVFFMLVLLKRTSF